MYSYEFAKGDCSTNKFFVLFKNFKFPSPCILRNLVRSYRPQWSEQELNSYSHYFTKRKLIQADNFNLCVKPEFYSISFKKKTNMTSSIKISMFSLGFLIKVSCKIYCSYKMSVIRKTFITLDIYKWNWKSLPRERDRLGKIPFICPCQISLRYYVYPQSVLKPLCDRALSSLLAQLVRFNFT